MMRVPALCTAVLLKTNGINSIISNRKEVYIPSHEAVGMDSMPTR